MEKRLTATEREVMMRLNLALQFLTVDVPLFEPRVSMIEHGSSMLNGARGMIDKFLRECYKTIPTDQLKTLARSLRDASYTVGIRCPATKNNAKREDEYGVVVPISAINEVFAALQDHCAICMAGQAEAKSCKLRKALDAIPNDSVDRTDGGCQYRTLL